MVVSFYATEVKMKENHSHKHFLTFIVEFETMCGDSKVAGQPQGEDISCAGDRGRNLEAC